MSASTPRRPARRGRRGPGRRGRGRRAATDAAPAAQAVGALRRRDEQVPRQPVDIALLARVRPGLEDERGRRAHAAPEGSSAAGSSHAAPRQAREPAPALSASAELICVGSTISGGPFCGQQEEALRAHRRMHEAERLREVRGAIVGLIAVRRCAGRPASPTSPGSLPASATSTPVHPPAGEALLDAQRPRALVVRHRRSRAAPSRDAPRGGSRLAVGRVQDPLGMVLADPGQAETPPDRSVSQL